MWTGQVRATSYTYTECEQIVELTSACVSVIDVIEQDRNTVVEDGGTLRHDFVLAGHDGQFLHGRKSKFVEYAVQWINTEVRRLSSITKFLGLGDQNATITFIYESNNHIQGWDNHYTGIQN